MKIDGKKIAEEIIEKLKKLPSADWRTKRFLAVVMTGQDTASKSFIAQKEKVAQELGVDFRRYEFPEAITQDQLRSEIGKIAAHKTCGGIIVQLPLPEHIKKEYVLNAIPREKDVDILGGRSLGAFYTERNLVLPPAVGVVKRILDFIEGESSSLRKVSRNSSGQGFEFYEKSESERQVASDTLGCKTTSFREMNLSYKHVAIVGAGFLVGKPIATWLMGKGQEIYILDKGSDFGVLKNADVVICGTGVPGLVKPEMLKEGAIGIDFGYGTKEGCVLGDFDQKCERVCSIFTPTPGGTGPILVAQLFENFYTLNQKKS